jgi:hypothetical protein
MKNTAVIDRLTELVGESASDIFVDFLDGVSVHSFSVREIKSDTDDGVAYGKFVINVNDVYAVHLIAQAVYGYESDCYNWSSDSHYTKKGYYEDLEDFGYQVTKVENTQLQTERGIESDIDAAREAKRD